VEKYFTFEDRIWHGMRKKANILAILIAFAGGTALSQELTHQVMVPAAGIMTSGKIDLSQTIGESAVEIFSGQDYTITEGFQQPRIIKLDTGGPLHGINVYPNPVEEMLTIELSGQTSRSFVISIYNMYGVTVHSKELDFSGPFWYKLEQPVDDLTPGLYLVTVFSRDRVIRRVFKIEKM
jgi:hypothetical protein